MLDSVLGMKLVCNRTRRGRSIASITLIKVELVSNLSRPKCRKTVQFWLRAFVLLFCQRMSKSL